MRYRVNHTTRYSYSQAVFFEPHLFRMRPRSDVSQRLDNFSLVLHPQPIGLSHGLDVENNAFCLAWFEGLFDSLEITSSFVVETLRENPFDALLIGDSVTLPLSFPNQEQLFLEPYLRHGQALEPPDQSEVQGLAEEICRSVRNDPLAFLHELNQRLFRQIGKVERIESGIQTVRQTLTMLTGACRDTTVVFMEACRCMNIPARFVSGCQEGDPEKEEADLHAWAEVYLPGFGWRGYDPTNGLAVADRHIAYAASALPENATPVAGAFRGTGAAAELEHRITMIGF